MTKRQTYKGEPVTEELEERLVAETLAELANRTDEEVAAAKANREASREKFQRLMGRPALGVGRSPQLRVRVSADRLAVIDEIAERQHQTRSELLREALEEYIASR
jgi:Ribbon-helix-helix protein, copG family